ncbi:PadR family transcriptional regulator [Eubacterium ramulus]|uniref:PadR family transcriptional regulator n=1 Tax=Eubacterium ramulus TaxID=39490 RepID=UPI0039924F19
MSRNYFLTGITELLILTILKHQDSYAYEITKIIQQESLELISISHATIYTAIYKLENENYISEYSKKVGKKKGTSILSYRAMRFRLFRAAIPKL